MATVGSIGLSRFDIIIIIVYYIVYYRIVTTDRHYWTANTEFMHMHDYT